MQILLPDKVKRRLIIAIEEAGNQEIGGILMGEHIGNAVYRVLDLTIQNNSGTFMSFVRLVREITNPLKRFFHNTGHNFTRFNYLGEWHSHPSFAPVPSNLDCKTMWEIVEDPKVGANFVVLMIVRLDDTGRLEGTITVYLPGQRILKGKLIQEETMI